MAIKRKKGQAALTRRRQRRSQGRPNTRRKANQGQGQWLNDAQTDADAAFNRAFKGGVKRKPL
jgi:hypothetical protein